MRVILLLVLLLVAKPGMAQRKTGTTVGQFLLIEPSARVAAMGNAGVTTFDEVSAVFFNPAAAGLLERSDVQFTYSRWLVDVTYNYAAVGLRTGVNQTLLLTMTALNSGDIAVRTVEQPQGTGEQYSVNDLALGLGYSRRLTDRFSAGAQVKYVQETIWHSRMNALSMDFGVLYHLPFRAWLGASISQFGTRGRFDGRDLRVRYDQDEDRFGDNSNLPAALRTESYPLPILFRVGLGVPMEVGANQQVSLVVDAFQPSDHTNSMSVGAEWRFMNTFSARAGYQHLFQPDRETGLTLGAGLQYETPTFGVRFDYAWNDYGLLANTQRFTLGLAF